MGLLTHAERGRLGGLRTSARHGQVHMEAIGRAGLHGGVQRYYNGDVGAYMAALRARITTDAVFDPRLGCRVKHSA